MIAYLRNHRDEIVRVAVVIAILFAVSFISKPKDDLNLDTYSATDTRSGGYAAWQELLDREIVATEQFDRRPADLDGTIDTLIEAYDLNGMPADSRFPADTHALAAWVRAGGRLEIIGSDDRLEKLESTELARPRERLARAAGAPLQAHAFGDALTHLVTFSPKRFIVDAKKAHARALLSDRGGALIVRVPLGHGSIVYVGDPKMFSNAAIARDDNARLAYLLGRPRRRGGIVAFDEGLHGAITERGWWSALNVSERIALTGIVIAILIALAGSALRLGPAVALREKREPASDEFVAAVAALYAKTHARHAAIELLAGDADRESPAAEQLRALRERAMPNDADLVRSAVLARTLRREYP